MTHKQNVSPTSSVEPPYTRQEGYDEAMLKVRDILLPMTRRERFERKYSSWAGMCEDHIRMCRMSNGSYSEPKIANAWRWYEDGFVTCKIDMEIEQDAKR